MPENTHREEIGSASGCKSHLDASRWAPDISDICCRSRHYMPIARCSLLPLPSISRRLQAYIGRRPCPSRLQPPTAAELPRNAAAPWPYPHGCICKRLGSLADASVSLRAYCSSCGQGPQGPATPPHSPPNPKRTRRQSGPAASGFAITL